MLRAVPLLAAILAGACAAPEDPARVELRARLQQQEKLSPEEIGRVFDEVSRSLEGKTLRIVQASPGEIDAAGRDVVLGMLTERAGVFDEGLRTADGAALRVFNAPGRSATAEIEASRRLFVDVRSFLPRRFEFAHAFTSPDDYQFDLIVE